MGEDLLNHCIERVRAAPIAVEPFAHVIIDRFLPDDLYDELIGAFPSHDQFKRASYPGSDFGKKAANYRGYGLVLPDRTEHPTIEGIVATLESEEFCRTLLMKFSEPLPDGTIPIPGRKRHCFENGASDYHSRGHLHVDLPGYEIPPHPDSPDKIVTWLLYAARTEELREYGTAFCKPKNGRKTVQRKKLDVAAGRFIDNIARILRCRRSALFQRIKQSEAGFRMGLRNPDWLPWNLFDVAAMAPALPNHFMAFAPAEHTYHAVRLDIPVEARCQERPVIRGFIRMSTKIFERVKFLDEQNKT